MKKFYQIHGSNGGTFLFSVKSFKDWQRSLAFYRGVSFTAKCKKILLLLAYPLLKYKANFDGGDFRFGNLEPSCSAMISPTRDKVIIHRHGSGYEKQAFGKSLDGVRGELAVYRLLMEKQPESFTFSQVDELENSSERCRFYMKYADGDFSEKVPSVKDLLPALKEFFLLSGNKTMKWKELWSSLPEDLQKYIPEADLEGETPVGLVHRDFKPWNVKFGTKALFFDFESASFSGCPLEDFFNYIVEQQFNFAASEQILGSIQNYRNLAEEYLKNLNIPDKEFMQYWRWYLLERVAFWRAQGKFESANKFLTLYNAVYG